MYTPPGLLRRNLNICTWEGVVALPIIFLSIPANFIIAALLTKTFGMRESVFGLIASLPAWCNVLQVFLMPFLSRHCSPKTITVTFSWLHLAAWTVFVLVLPRLAATGNDVSFWFFVFFLFSSLFASVVGVSWTSWIQEWMPDRLRGAYLGRRNRLMQIATVLFLFFAGKLMGWMDNSVGSFQLLFAAAIFLRFFSILGQHRILSANSSVHLPGAPRWREQFKGIVANRSFVWLILFGVALGFALNVMGPFYPVFMYEQLGLTIQKVSIFVILGGIGGAVSFPAWGRMMDRYGNKPVMLFCLIGWQLQGFLWCILTPGNAWMLYFMWVWGGSMAAGFFLGSFNLLLRLISPVAKTTSISLYLGATSLVAALAPIIGGALLDAMLQKYDHSITVYHVFFLIQPIAALLSCTILWRVHEPKSTSLSQVVGAMRSFRQVGALVGLSFLVNYTFLKKPPKAKR